MSERERVGVREIRQNLSVYLERVRRGQALEITDRGQPVAILGPIPGRSSLVARLVAEGRAAAPARRGRELGLPPAAPATAPSISRLLDDLREDRV